MESTQITEKYVRKPLYVDAVQVTEENFRDIARWCFGEIGNIDGSPVDPTADLRPSEQYIHVRVHNPKNAKQTQAHLGDWILYTERGYKVYTTKAFLANFDKVSQDADVADSTAPIRATDMPGTPDVRGTVTNPVEA